MQRRRLLGALLSVALLGACRARGSGLAVTPDCSPPRSRPAGISSPFDTSLLVGRFELVQLFPRNFAHGPERSLMLLSMNDSLRRYYRRSPFSGDLRRAVDRPIGGERRDSRGYRDRVWLEGRTFEVGGCEGICVDASPTYLTIESMDTHGFRGRWTNAMTGNWTYVDRSGRPTGRPDGYFCARRVQ